MAGEATGPLAAIGGPGRGLPGQIARFGELASRDLAARAVAALRARGAYDPQRHGDAETCQPLTTGEQLEMRTLRAAITREHRPAAPAGTASAPSGPERLQRPAPLRRPPPPDSGRAPARHRRDADPDQAGSREPAR